MRRVCWGQGARATVSKPRPLGTVALKFLHVRGSSMRGLLPPGRNFFFETDRDPLSLDEDANDSGLEKGQKEPISVSPPSLSSIYARYASGEIYYYVVFYISDLSRR